MSTSYNEPVAAANNLSFKSEHINELAVALARAQGQMAGAVRDSENPSFRHRYADLESVWEACRKPLSDNGIGVHQGLFTKGRRVTVTTTLLHGADQWISSALTMTAHGADPQAIGSAISYARRYALAAAVGVYQTDDDGELASGDKRGLRNACAKCGAEIPQSATLCKGCAAAKARKTVQVMKSKRQQFTASAEAGD